MAFWCLEIYEYKILYVDMYFSALSAEQMFIFKMLRHIKVEKLEVWDISFLVIFKIFEYYAC